MHSALRLSLHLPRTRQRSYRFELIGRAKFGADHPCIFRVFGDAEPRDVGAKVVEWKYTRSGLGRKEPIEPPVNLEIVAGPGEADVFNPKFWEGLRCPSAAVQ